MKMGTKSIISDVQYEMGTKSIISDVKYENGHREYNFRCKVWKWAPRPMWNREGGHCGRLSCYTTISRPELLIQTFHRLFVSYHLRRLCTSLSFVSLSFALDNDRGSGTFWIARSQTPYKCTKCLLLTGLKQKVDFLDITTTVGIFWRVLSPKMLQNVPRCNSAKNQPLYKHGIHIIEKERNQYKQMSMIFFWNPHEFKLPWMWFHIVEAMGHL